MDAELKAKWCAALRSSKYKQGRRQLRTGTGADVRHCCLGVLCEVAGVQYEPCNWFPNAINQRYWGLEDTCELLAEMNDGATVAGSDSKSFSEIADFIDEYL